MTTTTPPAERIDISPGQLSASLDLRGTSALRSCTRLDSHPDGVVFIARSWPNLSTGEELLWEVLAWLNGQGPTPDLPRLRAGLDQLSYAAAERAVALS